MRILVSIFTLISLHAFNAFSYTIDTAAKTGTSDGSYGDTTNLVRRVIDRFEPGWILTLGTSGGSNMWPTIVQVYATNAITIQGAGSGDNRFKVTTNSFSAANATGEFNSPTAGAGLIRFTNFKLHHSEMNFRRGLGSNCFRIDNIEFLDSPTKAIFLGLGDNPNTGPGPYGLIDNNWFISRSVNYIAVFPGVGNDAYNWTNAHSFETFDKVIIEDNIFTNSQATAAGIAAIDNDRDGRWLARHNKFYNWGIVGHGKDSSPHALSQFEVLNNEFRFTDVGGFVAILLRGGTGIIQSNSFTTTGDLAAAVSLRHYPACNPPPVGTYSCSNYPCSEQIGRGVVAGVEGSVPLYIYGNTTTGTISALVQEGYCAQDASFIDENRDWYATAKPGYTGIQYPHPLVFGYGIRAVVSGRPEISGRVEVR